MKMALIGSDVWVLISSWPFGGKTRRCGLIGEGVLLGVSFEVSKDSCHSQEMPFLQPLLS